MMIDADIAVCSPSSVYRVLKEAGRLDRHTPKASSKGKGFVQPLVPHEHWHVDVSYINIAGTFYYLCSLLDGCSRFTVHWEIRESMTEADVEQIIQRAREKFPGVTPYYPQSNGKIERWHRILKEECIRPGTPLTLDDARRIVGKFVEYYNTIRLHSAIGYVTPQAKLQGREREIFAERDRKLEEARERRKEKRRAAHQAALDGQPVNATT